MLCAATIRARIDALEEYEKQVAEDAEASDSRFFFGQIKLGAPQHETSLRLVQDTHKDDVAFDGLDKRLQTYLRKISLLFLDEHERAEEIVLNGDYMVSK